MSKQKVKQIKVESINDELFPMKEVLDTKKEKRKRQSKLQKAVQLGAIHQMPVTLTFKGAHGLRKIEAVASALTKKYLAVKGGYHLPVSRIKNVKLL